MWVKSFGIEREGFFADGNVPQNTAMIPPQYNGATHHLGFLGSDAGVGLYEAGTAVAPSFNEAIQWLNQLEDGLLSFAEASGMSDPQIRRVPFRPTDWGVPGVWVEKNRYGALLRAAQHEGNEYHLIHRMPDVAAIHINVSGNFDSGGLEGVFLDNMFNHVAPYVAARVHADLGCGAGHLAIWRGFADERRFPSYPRWFTTPEDRRRHFTSTPKLILEVGQDVWHECPKDENGKRLPQVWGDPADHGCNWSFYRAKPTKDGGFYSEIRLLPSMESDALEVYGNAIISIIELMLTWLSQQDRFPKTLVEAEPVFTYVHRHHPDLFPTSPLTEDEWKQLRDEG
jgi:hypothetical protein